MDNDFALVRCELLQIVGIMVLMWGAIIPANTTLPLPRFPFPTIHAVLLFYEASSVFQLLEEPLASEESSKPVQRQFFHLPFLEC
jgi:hypothetical protein